MRTYQYFFIIFIIVFQYNSFAQVFDFVLFPHSISTLGTGEQGVAAATDADAFVYNPAKLSLTRGMKISLFRSSFRNYGMLYPLTSLYISYNIGNIGSFGFSYDHQNFGTAVNDIYERSFSAGYSRLITNTFSAGVQFRYIYTPHSRYLERIATESFSISLGLLYFPELWDKRLSFGISLMNLGPAIKLKEHTGTERFAFPPTRLNIGLNLAAIENDYVKLPLSLSISKQFNKKDKDLNGISSFKSIFSDWSDFPEDVTVHYGFSLYGKSADIGNGLSIFSEVHIGNFSEGSKAGNLTVYTHAVSIGISYKGFGFAAGYGGYTHNVKDPAALCGPCQFPYEAFQFEIELNNDLLTGTIYENNSTTDKIIISAGAGETVPLGTQVAYSRSGLNYSADSFLNYILEAAIYFNNVNAIVSSISYASFSFNSYAYEPGNFESKCETFSFFSSYRYHLLNTFHPLFIQGGIGISRLNPSSRTIYPQYEYKTVFQLSAGLQLALYEQFIFSPVVDFNFIPFQTSNNTPVKGSNQFNFLVKIGYVLL